MSTSLKVRSIKNALCKNCNHTGNSHTHTRSGVLTYAWCGLLLVLTGVCCCIPFVIDGCKDVDHKCSNCGEVMMEEKAVCCCCVGEEKIEAI